MHPEVTVWASERHGWKEESEDLSVEKWNVQLPTGGARIRL